MKFLLGRAKWGFSLPLSAGAQVELLHQLEREVLVREAKSTLFHPSQEKSPTRVLKGVRNISDTPTAYEIFPVKVHLANFSRPDSCFSRNWSWSPRAALAGA